jgi:hypothetical protein
LAKSLAALLFQSTPPELVSGGVPPSLYHEPALLSLSSRNRGIFAGMLKKEIVRSPLFCYLVDYFIGFVH